MPLPFKVTANILIRGFLNIARDPMAGLVFAIIGIARAGESYETVRDYLVCCLYYFTKAKITSVIW